MQTDREDQYRNGGLMTHITEGCTVCALSYSSRWAHARGPDHSCFGGEAPTHSHSTRTTEYTGYLWNFC